MTYNNNTLYINGEWQKSDNTVNNINPSDISDSIGWFSQASTKQVEEAIDAAKKAQKIWQKTSLEHKQKVLNNIGDELIKRCDELGTILSKEEGKTFAEGRGEIYRSGQFFQYYAAEVLRNMGELAQSVRDNVNIEVSREPLGVVGIISPWNFPTATASWKIAPALAFGNSVIWKPANATPASAVELTKIIHKQGLPAGTFNLVLGSGSSVGECLINSKDIDGISFTGSVDVGRRIAQATALNFVKCQLEMGSKNALVIANDADINTAVEASVFGSFSGTGQKCTASSRLIVEEGIYEQFLQSLTNRIKTLKVGHALDKDAFLGPVVDDKQLASNIAWVNRAKELGGDLVCGGERIDLEHKGYYMLPTLFTNTQNNWDVNQEEIFAPMTCIIKAKDIEESIAIANDTRFGLSSGIVTTSLKNSALFKQQIQSGCVMVNLPTSGTDYHVPFGGRKESSFGSREQGQYAREFYTIVKTTYQKSL